MTKSIIIFLGIICQSHSILEYDLKYFSSIEYDYHIKNKIIRESKSQNSIWVEGSSAPELVRFSKMMEIFFQINEDITFRKATFVDLLDRGMCKRDLQILDFQLNFSKPEKVFDFLLEKSKNQFALDIMHKIKITEDLDPENYYDDLINQHRILENFMDDVKISWAYETIQDITESGRVILAEYFIDRIVSGMSYAQFVNVEERVIAEQAEQYIKAYQEIPNTIEIIEERIKIAEEKFRQ